MLKDLNMRGAMQKMIEGAQDKFCAALSTIDDTPFQEDKWERKEGGGGRTRVLSDGPILEKAGVNISVVHGTLSEEAISQMGGGQNSQSREFFATGLSTVIHPRNPFAPTMHANVRYFERGAEDAPEDWWFGGGSDLTPCYLFDEDAQHFHQTWKDICDDSPGADYPHYKQWCDEYFFIPHRQEHRGVGGIFFDNLKSHAPELHFAFIEKIAMARSDAYLPILEKRKDHPYEESHKAWQEVRRGRYVEFNLVYDRGTRFGLNTGGRIESILMSLPLKARWEYQHQPTSGSHEEKTLETLKKPKDWI